MFYQRNPGSIKKKYRQNLHSTIADLVSKNMYNLHRPRNRSYSENQRLPFLVLNDSDVERKTLKCWMYTTV